MHSRASTDGGEGSKAKQQNMIKSMTFRKKFDLRGTSENVVLTGKFHPKYQSELNWFTEDVVMNEDGVQYDGELYASEHFVCFYSRIFEYKIQVP
jgi:hypothetical protein